MVFAEARQEGHQPWAHGGWAAEMRRCYTRVSKASVVFDSSRLISRAGATGATLAAADIIASYARPVFGAGESLWLQSETRMETSSFCHDISKN